MKNLKEQVEYILYTCQKSRNDDFILINEVYKRYYFNTQIISFDSMINNHKYYKLPSFESITRARRKLQAEKEELTACDLVKIARAKKESEYRELYKK